MNAVANERHELETLEADVRTVRDAMLAAEAARSGDIAATHPACRRSAANLVHYLELRHHDVRDLQARLAAAGLSSLGRSEAHVLATIEEVLSVLARLNGHEPPPRIAGVALSEGHEFLAANAKALLGTPAGTRGTRIMVTLPTQATDDPDLVSQMTERGMDIARVNCAHDAPEIWQRMIDHVRSTRRTNGHQPRVAMDLAGPKLRTGPLRPGPRVVRISPRRDRLGVVTAPALVWLTADHPLATSPSRVTVVPVDDAGWLERRQPGDRLGFIDSRGATRHWVIAEVRADGCMVTATQTAYVSSGLKLVCSTGVDEDAVGVGDLPEVEQVHRVDSGDQLTLTRTLEPAEPTAAGSEHRVGCSLPEAFDQAMPGERVWLDDGKIGGVIVRVTSDEIDLRVTDVRPGGANLKAGKGINFPDTDLRLDALTDKDLDDLDFVARHADMVNLSFVRHPADVEQLQAELERRDAVDVGIVLKIENVAAFEHLPELLLTAMRSRQVGVMIARGDLAVEVGFERLAEVQEEVLWACEAAHVPVIWATQVLDTLARTGQPSRAEITDAAMSERAECVMLNKGPHITDAIHTLDSILTRMQHHQHKKRSLLRRLQAWDHTPPGS
ncbi:MAG: pyruvate kinase [Acidimicrobiaceae bacterium]|nr:MAG: pyruvate kinase [Acidimicrobiaceae bacterium]